MTHKCLKKISIYSFVMLLCFTLASCGYLPKITYQAQFEKYVYKGFKANEKKESSRTLKRHYRTYEKILEQADVAINPTRDTIICVDLIIINPMISVYSIIKISDKLIYYNGRDNICERFDREEQLSSCLGVDEYFLPLYKVCLDWDIPAINTILTYSEFPISGERTEISLERVIVADGKIENVTSYDFVEPALFIDQRTGEIIYPIYD